MADRRLSSEEKSVCSAVRYGFAVHPAHAELLGGLIAEGLIEEVNGRSRLTPAGFDAWSAKPAHASSEI